MQKRIYVVFTFAFLALVLSALVVACGKPAEPAEPAQPAELDGEALAKERCSACHSFERVETAKKTPEEWKANVERMVAKGAKLDADEQEAVIEYLSEAYK